MSSPKHAANVQRLAETVLAMQLMSEKGLHAKDLAREILRDSQSSVSPSGKHRFSVLVMRAGQSGEEGLQPRLMLVEVDFDDPAFAVEEARAQLCTLDRAEGRPEVMPSEYRPLFCARGWVDGQIWMVEPA